MVNEKLPQLQNLTILGVCIELSNLESRGQHLTPRPQLVLPPYLYVVCFSDVCHYCLSWVTKKLI